MNERESQEMRSFRQAIENLSRDVRESRQEIDGLASEVTNLVKTLEQDDKLRERAEDAAEEERDNRHKQIVGLLSDIRSITEKSEATLRGLPESILTHIEKTIYQLRVARYEARKDGIDSEAAPLLPPPPGRREPTGSFRTSEASGAFAHAAEPANELALTPAQQRGIVGFFRTLWNLKWKLAGGGMIAEGLHRFVDWIRHL